jgi:hypothetical protein
MAVFNIKNEPVGVTYQELLRCSARFCDAFLLVVRNERDLNEDARRLLDNLSDFGISAKSENRWPGTELVNGTALVYRFVLNDSSIGQLSGAVRGLFDWVAPSRPEDLCFLRSNGLAWLTTIAHERDAYLTLAEGEEPVVTKDVPGLVLERSRTYQ